MLNLALDLDTGRWSPANSPVILYIVRLIVRVEDYLLFIIHHWHFVQSEGITTGGWQSHVRGLLSNEDNVRLLTEAQRRMRMQLDTAVFAMLERWCQLVTKANDISTACVLHAHMAYMYKNVQGHELNRPIVTTILAAQVFLTTRYVYDIDVKPGEVNARKKLKAERDDEDEGDLGIPDTEIFDLFQKMRWKVLRWLQQDVPQANECMEAIIRIVTFTGTRDRFYNADEAAPTRQWMSMIGRNCVGRYVPDMTKRRAVQHARQISGSVNAAPGGPTPPGGDSPVGTPQSTSQRTINYPPPLSAGPPAVSSRLPWSPRRFRAARRCRTAQASSAAAR